MTYRLVRVRKVRNSSTPATSAPPPTRYQKMGGTARPPGTGTGVEVAAGAGGRGVSVGGKGVPVGAACVGVALDVANTVGV